MGHPVIFHVDLDAFFASVEQVDNPQFKGVPVIVGAQPGKRGVVSTCSYEARTFGIRSAMPINQAYRLCPNGIFVRPRMERYMEISRKIITLLGDFTPIVVQISVDEARLDMSGTRSLFGEPEEAAIKIQKRIMNEFGLSISIGIATNAFLAKMASEEKKPGGVFRVLPEKILEFLDVKDPQTLPGVGKKTRDRLGEIGLNTIPAIREVEDSTLRRLLGEAAGRSLGLLSRGIQPYDPDSEPKERSLSSETTFQDDNASTLLINKTLLELSHQVYFRTIEEGWRSRTLVLKVRLDDFSTWSARQTFSGWLGSGEEVASQCRTLFRKKWNGQPVRLLGVSLTGLERRENLSQQEFFEDETGKKRRVEEAVLRLRSKYPHQVLDKASLLKSDPEN